MKIKHKSVLGGFLDPLADKIMVTTVALALGQQGVIPAALVVSKEGETWMERGGAARAGEGGDGRGSGSGGRGNASVTDRGGVGWVSRDVGT